MGAAAGLALAADSRGQPARRRLVVFGDSLVAGYGLPAPHAFPARLQAALGDAATVVDAGVSGDTSAGGLSRLDWAIGERAPELAMVVFGANDGLRGLPPERMEENLDRIVERLQAKGARVLLVGMRAPPNLGRDYAERFAAAYARVAERRGVPLYPFFLDGVAGDPALNQADGIHPNAAGVEVVVARILPAVRRLIPG